MSENLFSYGTLQKENVQMELFGRILNGAQDVLEGYKISLKISKEIKDMKGKSTFTKIEAEQIKALISKKVDANEEDQKNYRNKIRDLGFYYSDFSSSKHNYTVDDFKGLITIKDDK